MENKCVCVVTETYRPEINGVANTLGYWVDGMKQRGLVVQIVRPRQTSGDKGSSSSLESETTVFGLPIPGYPELKFGLPAHRKLKKLWAKRRPDAVYVATEGPLGLSAVRLARQYNIPVLSGFHTNFQSYSNFYRLGWLENLIFGFLRYFHNRTQGTLVPTKQQKQWLDSHGFKHVSVLRRGINTELFNPAKRNEALRSSWGVKPNEAVCLYVGRIAGEKNVDLLGKAYTSLKTAYPQLRFVFVGDGPRRKKLEEQFPDWIFTGMRTGNELAAHYASADIFMFPSLTDTFGNVVTEAMASGLGIVSFNDAAAKELLEHETHALLASPDDEDSFINNLKRALDDPELLKNLRKQSLAMAQDLSWDEIVDQFISTLFDPDSTLPRGEGYEHTKNIDVV